MTNPYAGQPYYEQAWQAGFDFTQANPNGDDTKPPDFSSWGLDATATGYLGQVWKEGAFSGKEAGIPVHLTHPATDSGTGIGEIAHVGTTLVMAATPVALKVLGTSIAALNPVEFIGEALLLVLIPNGPPAPDQSEEQQAWFAKACKDNGWEEFFVTVAWPDGHSVPTWYGHAHRDFDHAKAEILDIYNNTPGPLDPSTWSLQVAHYRCEVPYEIERVSVGVEQSH